MNKIPDWLKKYRIKTIDELKKEFSKDYDEEQDWRLNVPLHFIETMDKYAGKKIIDLDENSFRFFLEKKPISQNEKVFNYHKCNFTFAMIKTDFNEKIIKLMKL